MNREGRLMNAALDIKAIINDLDEIRREHQDDPKLGRTILKLREAFGDLVSLLPAPLQLPTTPSE